MPASFWALRGASFVALTAALASPAIAADAAAMDEPEIVVTAQRVNADTVPTVRAADRAIDRVPGGADVVDADEFSSRFAVDFRDTLGFSPGVFAQSRYGEEVRLSIRGSGIGRGFHLRGVTLLQDGVPINLADGSGDFQELDPTVLQHIEVYRGANALRFGSSSLGGAINAVTPCGYTALSPLSLRVDGGSYATLRGTLAASFASDGLDGVAAVTALTSAGYRAQSAQAKLRFNGNLGVRLSDNAETRFYVSANGLDQEVPGALTLSQALDSPRIAPPINVANDYARDVRSLRLQNKTALTLGANRVELGGFLNKKSLYHPIFQVIDQDSTDWGLYARFEGRSSAGDMRVDYLLGGTARFGSVDARQFVNLAGERGALTADAEQRARTLDAYGELRLYPLPELALIAGGQFVHGRREVENNLRPAASAARSYDEFSPKLGLLWTPAKDVQLYANLSRAAEIPTFSELVQQPVVGFVPLDPQTGWTVEIGTRGSLDRVSWDVSLYRSRLRGELLPFTTGPDIPASTFNAGRTIHQGIEAGLDVTLAEGVFGGGDKPDQLALRQVYQFSDFRFADDRQYGDNRLPAIPTHHYRAELRYSRTGFTLAPSIEWMPKGAWADYRNSVRAPGHALLGLQASVALGDRIELFVDARNLTDQRGVGDVSAVIAASANSAIYYPVEGRSVFGGFKFSL